MIKTTLTAAALFIALAPTAMADSREDFDVTITYSTSALTQDALAVERSVIAQARRACLVETASRIKRVDEVCLNEVVSAALEEINGASAEAGLPVAFTSTRLVLENQSSAQ